MTTTIPHSAIINAQMKKYLQDTADVISKSCDAMPMDAEFRGIYKNSLGTFTPLQQIAKRRLPLLKTAAGIVKRSPLLVASRQIQLAYVDLRRLIEVTTCYPYFAEHPIEWAEFSSNPGDGYGVSQEKPIKWAAHREIRWYSDYLMERYSADQSGLLAEAVNKNRGHYKTLSKYVHAALDHMTKKPLTDVFDSVSSEELKRFRAAQLDIFQSTLILSCAPNSGAIGKLSAIERAWFDRILGSSKQKLIRSGKFLG